jgi:thiol-disulfide isomerase/thioredoxin
MRELMLRKNRLRGWIFVALAAALLLPLMLLGACGGEDAAAPTSPAATEIPSATAAATPVTAPEPTVAPEPTAAPEATSVSAPADTPTPAATTGPDATAQPTDAPAATAAPATPQPTQAPATPAPTTAPATPEPTRAPATPAAAPAMPDPTAAPPAPAEPCEGTSGGAIGNCAPEFAGTQEWINSDPLAMESLRGKVVLIDFWTYTCINCIRTLPFLQTWHERYTDEGLVIIGVHTPEFEFEKVYDNVVNATEDMGVAWPVVQDNNFTVWSSYSNRYWPAKYLIDKDGVIQYRHFGEGRYAETEQEIRRLLEDVGAASEALTMPLPEDQQTAANPGDGNRKRTPELFAGWSFVTSHYQSGRGLYVGQLDPYNFNRDEVVELEIPPEIHPDRIYFKGSWYIGPESVSHARETEDYSDSVVLAYSSRSVNAVLTSESGEPYKVRVRVHGQYLTEENKGEDIIIGEDGESYMMVTAPRAYKIIEHPEWMQHQVLELFSMSDDFGLFSFTFGTYEDGF